MTNWLGLPTLASAHGGQIVLSAATVELVGDVLPDGVTLRDLGEHRLKDLERPEQLFPLEVTGLEQRFHRCAAWGPHQTCRRCRPNCSDAGTTWLTSRGRSARVPPVC